MGFLLEFSLFETWTSGCRLLKIATCFFDLRWYDVSVIGVWLSHLNTSVLCSSFFFTNSYGTSLLFCCLVQKRLQFFLAGQVRWKNYHMWYCNHSGKSVPLASEQHQQARSRLSSACHLFMCKETRWINIHFPHQLSAKPNFFILPMYWTNLRICNAPCMADQSL